MMIGSESEMVPCMMPWSEAVWQIAMHDALSSRGHWRTVNFAVNPESEIPNRNPIIGIIPNLLD
jgi:hypothetical protein